MRSELTTVINSGNKTTILIPTHDYKNCLTSLEIVSDRDISISDVKIILNYSVVFEIPKCLITFSPKTAVLDFGKITETGYLDFRNVEWMRMEVEINFEQEYLANYFLNYIENFEKPLVDVQIVNTFKTKKINTHNKFKIENLKIYPNHIHRGFTHILLNFKNVKINRDEIIIRVSTNFTNLLHLKTPKIVDNILCITKFDICCEYFIDCDCNLNLKINYIEFEFCNTEFGFCNTESGSVKNIEVETICIFKNKLISIDNTIMLMYSL